MYGPLTRAEASKTLVLPNLLKYMVVLHHFLQLTHLQKFSRRKTCLMLAFPSTLTALSLTTALARLWETVPSRSLQHCTRFIFYLRQPHVSPLIGSLSHPLSFCILKRNCRVAQAAANWSGEVCVCVRVCVCVCVCVRARARVCARVCLFSA